MLFAVKSAQFFSPIFIDASHKIAAIKPVRGFDVFPDAVAVFFMVRFFGFGNETAEFFRIYRISQFGIKLIRAVAVKNKILLDGLPTVN